MKPILVLQYPSLNGKRTIALAATRDRGLIERFKEVVLQEARLAFLEENDEVLSNNCACEIERLERVFEELEKV